MNEFSNLQALPDGEAELRVVVRLSWEDVAALGQEAGRLAKQMQRPVGLDEAVAHRLRTRAVTPAKPTQEPARARPWHRRRSPRSPAAPRANTPARR